MGGGTKTEEGAQVETDSYKERRVQVSGYLEYFSFVLSAGFGHLEAAPSESL